MGGRGGSGRGTWTWLVFEQLPGEGAGGAEHAQGLRGGSRRRRQHRSTRNPRWEAVSTCLAVQRSLCRQELRRSLHETEPLLLLYVSLHAPPPPDTHTPSPRAALPTRHLPHISAKPNARSSDTPTASCSFLPTECAAEITFNVSRSKQS